MKVELGFGCLPLATTVFVVERAKAPLQAAVPPVPVTLAEVQVTVIEEAATVGQLVMVAAADRTVRFQVDPLVPLCVHETVAAELPASGDTSGSIA